MGLLTVCCSLALLQDPLLDRWPDSCRSSSWIDVFPCSNSSRGPHSFSFLVLLCVCVCVYTHARGCDVPASLYVRMVCGHVCVHANLCRGPRLTSGVFVRCCCPLCILRERLFLNPQLLPSAGLACQLALSISHLHLLRAWITDLRPCPPSFPCGDLNPDPQVCRTNTLPAGPCHQRPHFLQNKMSI